MKQDQPKHTQQVIYAGCAAKITETTTHSHLGSTVPNFGL